MLRSARVLLALLAVALPGLARALDPVGLQADCATGDTEACLSLARAQTGVGLAVDLLAARSTYERACRLASAEGCQGAQGISRYLGRHVELSFLSSVPRVWALSGPARVEAGGQAGPAEDGVAAAILARMPFAELCYRSALEENTQVEGLLDLSLMVRAGAVSELLLHQASLGSEDLAVCIVDAVGRAALPAGTPDGELFLRLRAEPAPASADQPPVVQDHLADGAQSTIGDPTSGVGDRRLEVALTVGARQALGGTSCVLDELEAGRWAPATLKITMSLLPDGQTRGLRVVPQPTERQVLADCVGRHLQTLQIGQTGYDQAVDASLVVGVGPAWTATIVP